MKPPNSETLLLPSGSVASPAWPVVLLPEVAIPSPFPTRKAILLFALYLE